MQNRIKGIITGVSSYILWGVLGLYWSLLKEGFYNIWCCYSH